jgi:uncharacterized protein (DUF924 family)
MGQMGAPAEVLAFWLAQDDKIVFSADRAFDKEVSRRFHDVVEQAKSGALDHWADSPEGALALVILLDQMSRNIFRDSPQMYAADAKALATAKRAIEIGFDAALPKEKRRWLYMPFMHSEDLADQERSIELFARAELTESLPHAVGHADIVRRFGRFPHRNAILGRRSRPEEEAFLLAGGFSGVSPQATADGQD